MPVDLIAERNSYVAGRWIEGDEVLPVENPADETHVTDVSITPLAQIAPAIGEARRSFDEGVWSDLAVRDRAKTLHLFLDHIDANHEHLVNTLVAEAGQPTRLRRNEPVAFRCRPGPGDHRALPVHGT